MGAIFKLPADSAGAISPGLAIQQRERERALRRLARLREKAFNEIDRLIAFLDASDQYVMTELEDDGNDEEECWDEGAQCDDEGAPSGDDEPSLGSPACICCSVGWPDGPNPTGDQTHWAHGGRNDLEADDCDLERSEQPLEMGGAA